MSLEQIRRISSSSVFSEKDKDLILYQVLLSHRKYFVWEENRYFSEWEALAKDTGSFQMLSARLPIPMFREVHCFAGLDNSGGYLVYDLKKMLGMF